MARRAVHTSAQGRGGADGVLDHPVLDVSTPDFCADLMPCDASKDASPSAPLLRRALHTRPPSGEHARQGSRAKAGVSSFVCSCHEGEGLRTALVPGGSMMLPSN